jgi:competence protein ComEA
MPERQPDDTGAVSSDEPSRNTPESDPLAGLRLDDPGWPGRVDQLLTMARASPAVAAVGGVVLVALAVLVAWLVWFGGSRAGPIESTLPTAPVADASPSAPTSAPPAGPMVVHAAGAVVAPGVYELEPGARVADLVEAAGGLLGEADGDRLNLAGLVVDGSRIYVPRVGEEVPAELPESTTGQEDAGGSPGGRVDINHAAVDELDELPGIGPATAEAIVAHRRDHGPFGQVEDLIDVRGIGEAKMAQLRDLVRV